jgi:hypothetical protein
MKIEHLQFMRVSLSDFGVDGRVLATASIAVADREINVAFAGDWKFAQSSIVVAALSKAHIVIGSHVIVTGTFGEFFLQSQVPFLSEFLFTEDRKPQE